MIKINIKKQLSNNYPFSDTMIEDWDGTKDSSSIVFERIRNRINNTKTYKKRLIGEKYGAKLYTIIPSNLGVLDEKVDEIADYYYFEEYAYSLIFGFVIFQESDIEYKFYGAPEVLLETLLDYLIKFRLNWFYEYVKESRSNWNCFYNINKNRDMFNHIRDELKINETVHCKFCGLIIVSDSIPEILNSSLETNNNQTVKSLTCPICSNDNIFYIRDIEKISALITYYYFEKEFTYKDLLHIPIEYRNVLILHSQRSTEFIWDQKYYNSLVDGICDKYLSISGQLFLCIVNYSPENVLECFSSEESSGIFHLYDNQKVLRIIKLAQYKFRAEKLASLMSTTKKVSSVKC